MKDQIITINQSRHNVGIKQLIQTAPYIQAVKDLLQAGDKFKDASDGTRRKWKRCADKRVEELALATAKK